MNIYAEHSRTTINGLLSGDLEKHYCMASSPAEFSPIVPRQAGDLLLQISGDECRGLAPDDAAALLRGTENTKVGIVAERPAAGGAGGEKLDLIVTRRKFKVEGVIPREATVNGRKIGVRVRRCLLLMYDS